MVFRSIVVVCVVIRFLFVPTAPPFLGKMIDPAGKRIFFAVSVVTYLVEEARYLSFPGKFMSETLIYITSPPSFSLAKGIEKPDLTVATSFKDFTGWPLLSNISLNRDLAKRLFLSFNVLKRLYEGWLH